MPGTEEARQLPASEEAEKSVLSAMLMSSTAVDTVVQILRDPDDFHLLANRNIYAAILELNQESIPCDYIQVQEQLGRMSNRKTRGPKRDFLKEAGGLDYLQHISMYVDSPANVEYHAEIVRSKSVLRKVIQTSYDLLESAHSAGAEHRDLLDEAESSFFALSHGATGGDFVQMETLMIETMEHMQMMDDNSDLLGVDTGYQELNTMTSGFQSTDLIILAARPSMGKTALALNFVLNAANPKKSNVGVVFFSLEMSAEQLAYRMISAISGVPGQQIRTKRINQTEVKLISKAVNELGLYPILIDETPGISVAELRSKARRAVSMQGVGMIVVDYLQLMTQPPRAESNQLGVAMISKSMKALAKELKVPIIALSQLSRQVEQRGSNKRPMLSDLRDSGAIEQDADMVMFVFRPEMYEEFDENGETNAGKTEVIIGKHRNGPTGTVELYFEKQTGKFTKFEKHMSAPAQVMNGDPHNAVQDVGYSAAPPKGHDHGNPFPES
jgi:replicative DNA helicase